MKLTTKLILLFVSTTLSTIIIMGLFLYDGLWNDRYESIQREISKQLDDIDSLVSLFFEEVENDVSTLAANEYVRSRDDKNFTNFLNATVSMPPAELSCYNQNRVAVLLIRYLFEFFYRVFVLT